MENPMNSIKEQNQLIRIRKRAILALKIGVGSSAAIYIATALNLQFATSAGIVALLTLVTTKWETLRITGFRMVSFLISVALSWVIFQHIPSQWFAYGIYIVLIEFLLMSLNWQSTISVNAVIGTHFLTTHYFSLAFIQNEFLIVLIGSVIAIILNLFQNNNRNEKKLVEYMRHTEQEFKDILLEVAAYLRKNPTGKKVWGDIDILEQHLDEFVEMAFEYERNTFRRHTNYYVHYFHMRENQCEVLSNLHAELKKIRLIPVQANMVADFIQYLAERVNEMNDPKPQLERLYQLLEDLRQEEMPGTREEFESRAILYHVLLDLEDFLNYKRRFIEELDDDHFEIYWEKEVSGR